MPLLPKCHGESRIGSFFSHDHERLDRVFQRARDLLQAARAASSGPDAAELRAAFDEFRRGLLRHIQWEEDILFPAVESKEPGLEHGPGQVMRAEHRAIGRQLELAGSALDPKSVDRAELGKAANALTEIAAILAEHNEKEEAIYYPMADALLDADEIAAVLRRVQEHGTTDHAD